MTLNIIKKFDSDFNTNHSIALLPYNDVNIEYVLGFNYISGTQMAKACGKRISHWLENVQAAELCYTLAAEKGDVGIPVMAEWQGFKASEKVKIAKNNNYWGFIKVKKGGNDSELTGTFLHKELAIIFATWCNPQFALWVSRNIIELMTQGTVKLNDKQYQSFLRYQKAVEGFPAAIENECDLSYRIKLLADLCLYRSGLEIECPLRNIINKATSWRRIDFIKKNPRNVVIYELKNHKITLRDVSDTIAEKAYMELCKRTFNKPIKLIFLSPLGIADNAEYLIQQMPNVSYQSTQDFCKDLYIKGINTKWEINRNYINELVMSDKFVNLFNVDFIDTLSTVGKSKYIKAA